MASVHDQLITDSNYSAIAKYNKQQAQLAANGNVADRSTSVKSQEFLTLLTMQLQYQDPTNPMDNSEMLAQEAQFTTLEQMENLASAFTKFSSAYQANSFLGQTVEVTVDGKTTKGKVDYVDYSDASGASLSINGKNFPISSVTKIYPQDSSNDEDKNFIQSALAYIADNLGSITDAILNYDKIGNTVNSVDSTQSTGQ